MIKKRKIFYISGFDPRGLRYYREQLKTAIEKFLPLAGEDITISSGDKAQYTDIILKNKTQDTHNDYFFLKWDDIVRQNWEKNPIKLALQTLKTYFLYIFNIQWFLPLSKGPVITLFYPIVSLILIWGGIFLLLRMLGGYFIPNIPFLNIIYLGMAFIPAAYILEHIKSLWLLRFFIFNCKAFHTDNTLLDKRLEEFKEIILHSLNDKSYDEVMIIAHSNGSIVMIPLLEQIFKNTPQEMQHKLSILTLGQCLPLATYYKRAYRLRNSLHYLAQQNFIWHDITSPADGVCFALHDIFMPIPKPHHAKSALMTPQFHKYYTPENYKILRKNKFLLHFKYLETADKPSPYNFIKLITSSSSLSQTLADYHHVPK